MIASEPSLRHQPAAVRVAIASPYVWPYVRRGSERLLNDLAVYLHQAGLEVHVFAMAPHDSSEIRDGVHYHLLQERWRSTRRQFNSLHAFAWRLQAAFRDVPVDVVFCLSYFDAYAAVRARDRFGLSHQVIFQNVGIPIRRYFRAVPLDRWFMHTVLRKADTCLVLSEYARLTLQRDFGVTGLALPPPVFVDAFVADPAAPAPPAPTSPQLLFVGDLEEPRKGASLLCTAFVMLKEQHPTLRLCLAGRVHDATRERLLSRPGMSRWRSDVEFAGLGPVDGLPTLYRAASVTVLPAVWEAFGLVLVESLAAGTPVVGADHGGISDIVQGDGVGALFDPGPFGLESHAAGALAEAIAGVLVRGKTAAVQAACRQRAQSFSWRTLGPRYLELVTAAARKPAWSGATATPAP